MIQLVSDTVIDDIVTKRGYTPTIVRDLAARYRELAQHALKLEEALAYFQECCGGCPDYRFVLNETDVDVAANVALREHVRLFQQYQAWLASGEADQ